MAALGPVAASQDAVAPLGQFDASLTRLFTPLAAPPGTYAVFRSEKSITELTERLRSQDPAPAPGAWEPTRPEVHDAFGRAGYYDRFKLAELFGGKRLTVVRGTLTRDGRHVAYTLISPYPDPTLSRIEPGTMTIVFNVPF
jgi:hypothetical protein